MEHTNSKKIAYSLLIIGFVAFVFSSGRWNFFLAAWVWPFAFLYFERQCRTVKEFLPLAFAIIVGNIIKWFDFLGVGWLLSLVISILWSCCWILPFVADRLLFKRLHAFAGTLVFPGVFASIEIAKSFTMGGSVGAVAYTQYQILPLIQISSVIGSFGLSFIILWLGPVLYLVISESLASRKSLPAGISYLVIFTLVLTFGMVRISQPANDAASAGQADSIKVALNICPYYEQDEDGEYEEFSYKKNRRIFDRNMEASAKSGAEIACWNEEAFCFDDSHEKNFLENARAAAVDNEMTLVLPYELNDTDNSEDGLSINKLVMILPSGKTIHYTKTNLVPAVETGYVKGDGNVPTVRAKETVITSIICYDLDYPAFIRGFGRNADPEYRQNQILFAPTWDWPEITAAHSSGAVFRAIENGYSLVRCAYDGISFSADCKGNLLGYFDTADTGFDYTQCLEVSTERTDTFYSKYGTFVDMFIILLTLVLVIAGIRSDRKDQ